MGAETLDNEQELVRRASSSGDVEAFATLVRRHDGVLRSLAFRMLESRELMEDVLQEAYLRAFRALPRFRGDALVSTWLYRLVYTACIDELRRARRRRLDDNVGAPAASGDLADGVVTRLDLVAAMSALPVEERVAVLLVDGSGLDYAAAADVLGVPAGTVASRLSRARSALRAALAEREGEEALA